MYVTILGRQPAIGFAELERLYGAASVRWFSENSALVEAPSISVEQLGGSQKVGWISLELRGSWPAVSRRIVQHYSQQWRASQHKITLGISTYGFKVSPHQVQKTGLLIKQSLRCAGVNLRLIPNTSAALNTATSHHNKLGLSPHKVELLVLRATDGQVIVAESRGAQNITAYARRDRQRPRRDAFVGMLPPKLAQIMVNLAVGGSQFSGNVNNQHILDPFCGTGTVLQEALLKGYSVHGSDLSQKMVDYTRDNLGWLSQTHRHIGQIVDIRQGDATSFNWAEAPELAAVVCETYLGQPFSAPPKPDKLKEVAGNCNNIISQFLANIQDQITPGTPLVIAVPAWRDADGKVTHLPLLRQLDRLGYNRIDLQHVNQDQLLYYRENQVVARQLLLLTKC